MCPERPRATTRPTRRSARATLSLLGAGACLSLLASSARAQWQPQQGLVIAGTVVTMNDAAEVLPGALVFRRLDANTNPPPAIREIRTYYRVP